MSSSLLQRARTGLLMLLLVVLPLQAVVQLVAGLHGHRHVHTSAVPSMAGPSPLRALLDRLHAAQDPRLQMAHKSRWAASKGPAAELHEHGGVFHQHSQDTADALDVGDSADEAGQGGVTAFLAWLPGKLGLPELVVAGGLHVDAESAWRDRVVAPPLTPPRG